MLGLPVWWLGSKGECPKRTRRKPECFLWPPLWSHSIASLAFTRPAHSKEGEHSSHILMGGKLKSHCKKSVWMGDIICQSLEIDLSHPLLCREVSERELARVAWLHVWCSSLYAPAVGRLICRAAASASFETCQNCRIATKPWNL